MRFVSQTGFEHHVAMVRGHPAGVVRAALPRVMGLPFYHHGGVPEPQVMVPARFCAGGGA